MAAKHVYSYADYFPPLLHSASFLCESATLPLIYDHLHSFSPQHVNKNAASAQIVDPPKPAATKVSKGKTTEIEVLNPKSSGSQADAVPAKSGYAPDAEQAAGLDEDEDEEIPTFTPSARRFTQLEIGNWEASFKAISSEPSLLHDDVNDAILMEAFEASMRGDTKYARACVHQSLVLQYCRKLGKDGVSLFFKR